jgi:hypothetical protein
MCPERVGHAPEVFEYRSSASSVTSVPFSVAVVSSSDIPSDEMTKPDYVSMTNWYSRVDLRLIFLVCRLLPRCSAR